MFEKKKKMGYVKVAQVTTKGSQQSKQEQFEQQNKSSIKFGL